MDPLASGEASWKMFLFYRIGLRKAIVLEYNYQNSKKKITGWNICASLLTVNHSI